MAGSSTPYRQVTNIFSGMSGQRCSLTRSSTDARVDQPLRGGAQHAAGRGHHQGGRDALVGDVADDEADLAVRQRDHVVEVAADLAGRPVVGGDLPAGQLGELLGQEVLLDQPATSSSCSKRCRVAASACCWRTSWPTRSAGAAWAARLSSSLRSSVE